jgi:hypothetical protein
VERERKPQSYLKNMFRREELMEKQDKKFTGKRGEQELIFILSFFYRFSLSLRFLGFS